MIFFKFEDESEDFPFYNGIPKLSIVEWVILALAPILMGLIIITPIKWNPYYDLLPNCVIQISYFLVTYFQFYFSYPVYFSYFFKITIPRHFFYSLENKYC